MSDLSTKDRMNMSLDEICIENQKKKIINLIRENEKLDKANAELENKLKSLENQDKIKTLDRWRWHNNYENNTYYVSGYLGYKLWETTNIRSVSTLSNAFIIVTESESVYKLYFCDCYD